MIDRSVFYQKLRETFPNQGRELSEEGIDHSLDQRLLEIFPDADIELTEERLDVILAIAAQIHRAMGSDADLIESLSEAKRRAAHIIANLSDVDCPYVNVTLACDYDSDADTLELTTTCSAKPGREFAPIPQCLVSCLRRRSVSAEAPQASASESKEADETERAGSPDSDGLGSRQCGRMTLGHVDEVNGPGATLCPDFVPTCEELRVLARHWSTRALDVETFFFETGQSGSTEMRLLPFAHRRVDRIAEVLGRDSAEEIVAEVRNACRREMGDRMWSICESGTDEERERVQAEAYAARRREPSTPSYALDHLKEEAATVFPELPARELAMALRLAANEVEACSVKIEPCVHEWQVDPDRRVWGFDLSKAVTVFQRCRNCRAMREHEIYSDGPDFAAAVELARQRSPAGLLKPDEDTDASPTRAHQEPQD